MPAKFWSVLISSPKQRTKFGFPLHHWSRKSTVFASARNNRWRKSASITGGLEPPNIFKNFPIFWTKFCYWTQPLFYHFRLTQLPVWIGSQLSIMEESPHCSHVVIDLEHRPVGKFSLWKVVFCYWFFSAKKNLSCPRAPFQIEFPIAKLGKIYALILEKQLTVG